MRLFIKRCYVAIACCICCVTVQAKGVEKDILQHTVNAEAIDRIVGSIDNWRENKKAEWLKSLNALPDSLRYQLIKKGEKYLHYDWPTLKAVAYLGFKAEGNRTVYESAQNTRREVFESLVQAELAERKGRFIPQIVNGLWLILEESTWVSPAHLSAQKLGLGLPHAEDMSIDLGSGRQAVSVALAYFMLKDDFDKYATHINIRILHEIRRRIITPYIERNDYWWMSFQTDFVNNWNIWINTNVLKTLLLVEEDKNVLRQGISKVMHSADRFINSYPLDGACEEGPTYWIHAGGELGSMLRWIQDVSNEAVSFSSQQKLNNIGKYIIHTRIAENVYVNFADAFAIENVNPIKLWNFYQVFKDNSYAAFANYLAKRAEFKSANQGLHDLLEYALVHTNIHGYKQPLEPANYYYYESLGQVLINNRTVKGTLFISAIGSHNDVSHNHNDVGSYMVYFDGKPILIDVGVGTYNAKTFSSKRYEIWNMQSQYHNLPIINGVQQKEGENYKATGVMASENSKEYAYSVNIANAYPEEAAVENWTRTFKLIRSSNTLDFEENYKLKTFKSIPQVVFMTKTKPIVTSDRIELSFAIDQLAVLQFNTKLKDIRVEEIAIDDKRIERVWGEKIYRVIVDVDNQSKIGHIKYSLTFK